MLQIWRHRRQPAAFAIPKEAMPVHAALLADTFYDSQMADTADDFNLQEGPYSRNAMD